MKHFIIGTAGHVDHGKTMLIKALTGKDTDRLKEEKERGISIELGFAPFTLPSGILAGVVDVPGHERFIKNMLAGVGGMDLVLLVIAADEGIMPQTREHLDIIDLLSIPRGIVVITKTDMVEEEWIDLVKEEIMELVEGTVLESAPVTEVSAVTGRGIPELIGLIDQAAAQLKERPVSGRARMPVDRVFSMTGFGTVVTGTLLEGSLTVGGTVEILPEKLEARIRGLQVHGKKTGDAVAGQRVAVNLAGIEKEEIGRGSVLAAPGLLKTSHRADVKLRLLPGAAKPLANRARVRVHIGTSEILARVILLENDELEPGKAGFAQLECEEPIVAARGDLFVVRSYSPMRTIGGGKVIDSGPPKRKRLNPAVIETLKTKEKGTPEELLQEFMYSSGQQVYTLDDLLRGPGMDEAVTRDSLALLVSQGLVKQFSADNKSYFILEPVLRQKEQELSENLEKYHNKYPLRQGISKEETRSRLFSRLNNKQFNALLELYRVSGLIKITGDNISKNQFEPRPGKDREQVFKTITERYLSTGFQTPGWDEITGEFKLSQAESEEVLNFFINRGLLVKLEDNILIHVENLEGARNAIVQFLREHGEMSLGEARDLLNTSRKYALPVMNYFDREKVTRRMDDKRVLY
ncbi:MAG: selenocysteine-specific translation elongation factor [Firmicutes bacterium HGW-Firmicutes-14]|nr:MAG: selenocysteine-specific translation elongation factor [Firmicutes bacterium HGW-Firmicutes-14]